MMNQKVLTFNPNPQPMTNEELLAWAEQAVDNFLLGESNREPEFVPHGVIAQIREESENIKSMNLYDEIRQYMGKPEGEILQVPDPVVKYAVGCAAATFEVRLTPAKRLSRKYHALILTGINAHDGTIYFYTKPCGSLEELEHQLKVFEPLV